MPICMTCSQPCKNDILHTVPQCFCDSLFALSSAWKSFLKLSPRKNLDVIFILKLDVIHKNWASSARTGRFMTVLACRHRDAFSRGDREATKKQREFKEEGPKKMNSSHQEKSIVKVSTGIKTSPGKLTRTDGLKGKYTLN